MEFRLRKNLYFRNENVVPVYSEWRKEVLAAREAGLQEPVMPRFVADHILLLAENFTRSSNFVGYSYRDEMKADIIETLLRYSTNFDPEKGNNLYGYWTRIAHNTCVHRINSERKQEYVKGVLINRCDLSGIMEIDASDESSEIQQYVEFMRQSSTIDTSYYEQRLEAKRLRRSNKTQEERTDDDAAVGIEELFSEFEDRV